MQNIFENTREYWYFFSFFRFAYLIHINNHVLGLRSGPVTALVLEKRNAIKDWRSLIGPTNSLRAKEFCPETWYICVYFVHILLSNILEKGHSYEIPYPPLVIYIHSLRAIYGTDSQANCLHGSDSRVGAEREAKLIFKDVPSEKGK